MTTKSGMWLFQVCIDPEYIHKELSLWMNLYTPMASILSLPRYIVNSLPFSGSSSQLLAALSR